MRESNSQYEISQRRRQAPGLPPPQGLYDPAYEHDACGVGFVAYLDGRKSHAVIERGIEVLCNLLHRGATGADMNTGDGAGLLFAAATVSAPSGLLAACPRGQGLANHP